MIAVSVAVAGHPQLRGNRFLASFGADLDQGRLGAAAWDWWLGALAGLDRAERRLELARLPEPVRASLDPQRLASCSATLTDALAQDPAARTRCRKSTPTVSTSCRC